MDYPRRGRGVSAPSQYPRGTPRRGRDPPSTTAPPLRGGGCDPPSTTAPPPRRRRDRSATSVPRRSGRAVSYHSIPEARHAKSTLRHRDVALFERLDEANLQKRGRRHAREAPDGRRDGPAAGDVAARCCSGVSHVAFESRRLALPLASSGRSMSRARPLSPVVFWLPRLLMQPDDGNACAWRRWRCRALLLGGSGAQIAASNRCCRSMRGATGNVSTRDAA